MDRSERLESTRQIDRLVETTLIDDFVKSSLSEKFRTELYEVDTLHRRAALLAETPRPEIIYESLIRPKPHIISITRVRNSRIRIVKRTRPELITID